MIEIPQQRRATYLRNCRLLAVTATVLALLYLKWLLVDARPDDHVLYWVLVGAEVFNVVQAAGFWYTVSVQRWSEPPPVDPSAAEPVDVFVTVCGEPPDVLAGTLEAAAGLQYPRYRVHVLDDGPSAAAKALAETHGARYLTREDREGAKAGNLNHALGLTSGRYFAVFDADHAPLPEFLTATVGAFRDEKVAFVQTPQVYRNREENRVASGAHEQQGLFYGPILRGKNACGAVFSCGTNVVYRREAVEQVGGFPQDSITEDLRISLLLASRGWRSVYVSRVLAEGLGPFGMDAYLRQQLRWGRGGLEILLKGKFPSRGLTLRQSLEYGLGFLYWFTGWAYLAYLVLPVAFLVGGLRPVQVPNDYPVHFLPYAIAAFATILYASDLQIRFDALTFTLASFPVHVKALLTTLLGRSARFVVTPKSRSEAGLRPVAVLVLTIAGLAASSAYGLAVLGAQPSVVNNVTWAAAHVVILQGFVRLALRPERKGVEAAETAEAVVPEPERVLVQAEVETAPEPSAEGAVPSTLEVSET